LANLLGNAAKYTPPRGSIWLTAERVGDEVMVRVRDTGVGLPPALLPRIFDLFVQGDASLDRTPGGLGIGLTLVHALVELPGGRARCRSLRPRAPEPGRLRVRPAAAAAAGLRPGPPRRLVGLRARGGQAPVPRGRVRPPPREAPGHGRAAGPPRRGRGRKRGAGCASPALTSLAGRARPRPCSGRHRNRPRPTLL